MSLTNEELKWATILALTEPPQRCKPVEPPEPPAVVPYLTFHSEDGEFTLGVYDNTKHWDGTLEYSTDTETWTTWTGTTTLSSSGGYLYMRGSGNSVITGGSERYRWILSGAYISCSGNIETLLDYETVARGEHPRMASSCYANMFRGCTGLTTAPELPATTLASDCYYYMFSQCTSLTTAPELPATTLAGYCYADMFYQCTSLTTAPELPATTLARWCYADMFSQCTSLTTAPELPATTLDSSCYASMFYKCTSLTTAPKLPATTLASSCYADMFYQCTSLITAPKLPATTLASSCYYYMFYKCTSLRLSSVSDETYLYPYRIPTSGTGTTAGNALAYMFAGTGGPFTGTPSINTTYYTDHEPV